MEPHLESFFKLGLLYFDREESLEYLEDEVEKKLCKYYYTRKHFPLPLFLQWLTYQKYKLDILKTEILNNDYIKVENKFLFFAVEDLYKYLFYISVFSKEVSFKTPEKKILPFDCVRKFPAYVCKNMIINPNPFPTVVFKVFQLVTYPKTLQTNQNGEEIKLKRPRFSCFDYIRGCPFEALLNLPIDKVSAKHLTYLSTAIQKLQKAQKELTRKQREINKVLLKKSVQGNYEPKEYKILQYLQKCPASAEVLFSKGLITSLSIIQKFMNNKHVIQKKGGFFLTEKGKTLLTKHEHSQQEVISVNDWLNQVLKKEES
jgi:hypothetical protein